MSEKLNPLKICVTILVSLQILFGAMIICMTARYHNILNVYLAKGERQVLLGQLSTIYLLGFELLVSYSAGLILWRFAWRYATFTEHSKLLAAWNCFCILIVTCGLITIWFLYGSVLSLQNAAATALFQGMDLYFADPEWKLLWDQIQYNNECCGVFGYEDWKEAMWMPDELNKFQTKSKSSVAILVPYACCKRSITSCFQNYAPQFNTIRVPFLNSTDINLNGCLPIFNLMTCQLFYILAGMVLIVFILQVLILVFVLAAISKSRKIYLHMRDSPASSDERPLVVVRYPRNVRCVTMTNEENDELDENYEDGQGVHESQSPIEEGFSIRQETTEICDGDNCAFLH